MARFSTAASGEAPKAGPFALNDRESYAAWRAWKLAAHPRRVEELVVPIGNPRAPTADETAAILELARRANMAVFDTHERSGRTDAGLEKSLKAFAAHFGLTTLEDHRSRDAEELVPIEVVDDQRQGRGGFIPYTTRRLLWHTDGYYKFGYPGAPVIRAMMLYCVRQAKEGGENDVLDPEIAYIRLRDADPRFITALMAPDAMTIPAFTEQDGRVRPRSQGPVFWLDAASGALHMRYTERTRHVIWKDDPLTREAVAALRDLLRRADDPYLLRLRLLPGQGLICNNVLHTRSAFVDWDEPGRRRLLYRGRYTERIGRPAM
ncbi:MAG TPA: taurine catabolism dioxygenase TauD [Thermopetrobacter sp.]|nr:taurine catabolism dioxygenase TauD [Thermopetrobacter sp.]